MRASENQDALFRRLRFKGLAVATAPVGLQQCSTKQKMPVDEEEVGDSAAIIGPDTSSVATGAAAQVRRLAGDCAM